MQLSWHFTLEDLTRSDTATRLGIENTPGPKEVANLKRLAALILEPIYGWAGPIIVTSGFRCLELNRALKSKDTSAHIKGMAADIVCTQGVNRDALKFAVNLSRTSNIGFQQLINEYDRWVHISLPEEGQKPAKQLLTIDHQGAREGLFAARPKVQEKTA